MHFHLPKPLHGWREFAGEVGIIVLGVLIALGFEQIVEASHRRQEGLQADDAIRSELDFNLGRLQSRMGIHACVHRRIDEIQALLDKAAAQPDIATPNWIGRPQYWAFASSRWEAESQAGRAALVDPGNLSKYAVMYARMHDLLEEMTVEQTDWAKLRTGTRATARSFERVRIERHAPGCTLSRLAARTRHKPVVRHGEFASASRDEE